MKKHGPYANRFTFLRLLVYAFVLAVFLRICLALTLAERLYWPDSNWYFFVAERISSGQGFGQSLARGPLYPYFLSLVFLFSSRILVVRICEAVVSAFACVVVGVIGKRLFSERVGILAAFVSAVYPYFVYLPSAQGSDNIVTFLLLVSVFFLVGKGNAFSHWGSVLSGFFLGLSFLARPSMAVVLPGVLAWPAFLGTGLERALLFRRVMIVTFVSLGTVVPWTIHNYVVTGQFVVVSTGGGRQFWYGNSVYATGSTTENPVYPPELAEKLKSLPDESSREKLLYKEGLGFIRQHPGAAARLYVKKLGNLFQVYPSVHTSGTVPERRATRSLVTLGSAVLFMLSFLGAVLVLTTRSRATLLPLVVVSYCLGSAVFLTIMRYRLPADPYLILLGSAAFAFLLRWPSGLRSSECKA